MIARTYQTVKYILDFKADHFDLLYHHIHEISLEHAKSFLLMTLLTTYNVKSNHIKGQNINTRNNLSSSIAYYSSYLFQTSI